MVGKFRVMCTLLENLRSTTRPLQRRAFETKKFVMQDKNCE
jgi:hypothetical protein